MPAAPRRRLAALLLGPLMVIGLLLGLASPAGAQRFPQPVGIGATPDEIRTINLYFRFGVATDNIEFPIATGGTGGLTYSVTGNPGLESLGFSFDPTTRIFKGTPTLAGAGQAGDGFAFNYRVNSSAGGGFALIFVKVTVCEGSGSTDGATVCTPPDFAALGFAAALAGQSYTVGTPITALTLPVATGGTGSSPTFIYWLTGSGGLPDGLSFDAATRRLTGTPTTAKQSTLTYRVQDAASLKEFSRQFPLDVNAAAVDADTTPPTVTLDTIAEGVIGTAQDYDITFSEAVTGLAVDDFSVSTNIVASGDLVVNSVTPASGPSTTYTISITPRATAFTLTLAADSVMDTATTPNMGPATAASVSGSATAPELPLITGPATLEISENTSNDTLLGTYTTTADVRIFALITNVLDVDLFRIRPNGELRFDNSPVFSPDYEAPQDQGADNVYNLTIRGLKIVDGDIQTLVQDLDIVVTIINVDEPGAISAITGDAQVGETLTAGTVTDEDSPADGTPVSSITHQWQSAVDGTAAAADDAAWPDISGATGATYEPVVGDVGRIIRVVATYTDGEGSGKKVASAATGAVAAAATTAPTSDTSLATLTLTGSDGSEITLTPAFMAGVSVDSPYTASVANGVTSVTIAASSTHATTNIVVVVNGAQVTGDKSPSPVTDTGNLTEVGSTPNTIEIEVTSEDGNSFESYDIRITRAGPPPGIALRRDTAADGGVNTDRLTRNRDIDVTLATGFDTNSDTWEYSTDAGATDFVPGTGTGFTLPAVSADYAADQVRVRQTVDGIRSDFAGLDAFTIDADAPTANLGTITGAVIDQAGQTHDITFSEAVAGLAAGDFSASTGITVTAVSGSDGGTAYTITYTATAASFNLILTAGSVTDLAAWPVAETSQAGTATTPLPVITGPATLSIPENTSNDTLLGTYTTTADVDRLTVFTSVLEGGLLRLGSNGELRFDNEPSFSPDYEAPRDQGADNVYNITIRGVDGSLQPVTQGLEVTITVTNVDEPGAISAITGDAQVGVTLTAGTVTDLDSPPAGMPVSSITYQWQSAVDGTDAAAAVDDAAWPDISGATGATYDPVVGDVGRIIRVVATYTDGEGGGKKVASAATGAVAAAPVTLSTDSTLSALEVSAGSLNPTFDAATDAYAVSVGTDVASVTVTPTTTDDGAAVAVNGAVVASGQPSEAIDLNVGNNTITILVAAEDGVEEQTYTVTVARAVPQPGIALASDTARDGGTNTDRITRNRSIVVTLHADFQNARDTWEWSSNSGNSHTTGSNTDRSFDLTASQATYNDNVVRARQTVNGVVSEFAGLAMFQHDTVKPTISLNGGGASVTITKGDAYNDPVTADDALDGTIDPSHIVITGGPVEVDTAGEYTLTYNVMDRAGNAADPLTRTVTVSEPTATAPEPPVLSAGTTTHNSIALSWGAVTNAESYTLTRVVAGGANVVVFSGNALTATDTGLTAETSYKYVVTVTVGGRTSADSNEVDATTLAAPVTTPAPTVTVERLPDNSIKVSWDNIGGVDFTIYAIKTGVADAVIIDLVTSPHTIATTDPLFDTVNNADAIGVRGFAEGNPVGDHSAQITSDEVPDEAPAVTDTTPPTVTLGTIAEGVIGTAQDYDITFSEEVTGLAVDDFSVSTDIEASGDLVVNSVTPASGPSATYTISIIPRATAFTLTLTANSVMDTATTPNMGPAAEASAIGSATAGVALTAPPAQSYTVDTAIDALILPEATGGTGDLTYDLTGPMGGALPAGLDFTAGTRTLSGTPGMAATTELTYTVTDTNGATAVQTFMVTVNDGVTLPAQAAQSYTVDTTITELELPEATGGTAPRTYTLTGPAGAALPAGLTFTAASRTLSGTPTAVTSATTLTYTVTDANDASTSQTFEVAVNAGLALTAPGDQSYTLNTAINDLILLEATGGTGPLSYTLTGPAGSALPAGLSFDENSRTLSGTPDTEAVTILTYTVTDANDATTMVTFTVTVNDGVTLPAPSAQSYTLNAEIADLVLSAASGGTAPLTYALTGALPAGLTFNAASRRLTGTPTAVTSATTLTYTVTDANDATASQTFTVTVNDGVTLPAPDDQSYTLNAEIADLVLSAASGGTVPLTYALTNLPDGLDFDADAGTRTLSGTPGTEGSTTLTYTVTDTNGATASQTFTVAVNTGLALSAPPAPSYTVDTAIDALVLSAATGGTGALTYTLTGPAGSALPGGLTFAAGTRTLSGTPSTADVTVLTYTVTDTNGATATADFAVTVNAGLALTSPGAQGYTVDTAIDALVLPAATGGTAPLTYALTGLPGLSFTAGTRTLSGTPSTVGSTALAYRVTDANGATASQIFTVTVNTGLTLTAPDNQSYTVDTAITELELPEATGGTGPLSYTLTGPAGGALPGGLTFTAGTRTLSGTPTAVTSATTLTYTVTDANGATASQTFMVTVNEARTPPPPRPTDPTPEPDPEPEPNTAPVADAGAPPIAAEGATVTLNGRGSSDPDDDTLTYAWRQTGGTSVSLSGANTATPGFTAPSLLSADAELVFRLTVSDGSLSATDTVTVTVTHVNDAPGADAGEPQTVAEGAAVTLRGTGTDPDGDDAALRYAWSQTDTGAPRVSLSGADTATSGFTAPSLLSADAELVFRLTVSDGSLSATDTVTITVTRPRDTVAPVITLLGDSPLEVNQGATYADPGATASDDTDGDLSVGIVVGGDTVDTDTIGAYNVTYDVSDAAGNAAATVTRIVRVVVPRDLAALNEAILPEVARDIADRNVSAIARRIEQARLPSRVGSSASLGGASSLAEIATSQGSTVADDRFDLQRLLNNSNFVLPLSATGAGAADGTQLTLWGAGDYRDLKGADGVRWSGDLFSLQLGLDARLNERTILGVSVSGSKVELNYTNPGPAAGGNYDLDMTSVHPYLGWSAGSLDFWATLGYGEGELEISADGAQTDIASSDLSMQTLGLGANGVLMATGTTTLLLKTEALSTQLEVDASEEITAITQQAHRVRMTLEAIRGHSLDSGARLETSLEAGLRYDGGDGETGAGAELGGGLRYANLGGGLVIEGKARALVGGKGDTEEWGLSGLIKLSPAANGRGLSFSLTPGYGVTASGVERLWQQGLDDGLEAQGGTDGNNYTPNLDLRLDYGMDVSAMPGLVTPYTEFSFGATGDTYRLGLQWQRSKWFDLKLVAERAAGQITADHRIYIEGEIVF